MSDQRQDRIAKREKLRAAGIDPYGSRFQNVVKNAEIRAAAEKLNIPPGTVLDTPESRFRAAGRVVLYRDIGKLIFLTVRDWTGDLQFACSRQTLENAFSGVRTTGSAASGNGSATAPTRSAAPQSPLSATAQTETPAASDWTVARMLDLGDVIGIDGHLGRTKTGELTVWASSLRLLSKCVAPPPEKYHGLTDIEARYRRRYVDLFSNPESQRIFLARARIMQHVRNVLHQRGFIEVDTPVLQPIYGGAAARPFITHHNTLDMQLYLRISPELYLKRCMVGGLERVYEFSRCFRNEGISPRHNPEFTMLELYQAYGDYNDMMDITEAIIAGAARMMVAGCGTGFQPVTGSVSDSSRVGTAHLSSEHDAPASDGVAPAFPKVAAETSQCTIRFGDREIDYSTPFARRKYADLYREHVGIDIREVAAARRRAREFGFVEHKQDDAIVINTLFEHYVEDKLINPTFVLDYPAPICPLTKRHPDDPNLALRFELFINGTEIGNAYTELNDPDVQRATFSAQLRGEGEETMAIMDEDFVEALEFAMPPAGGLGIGIDRMVMLLTGSQSIRDVLLFPLQRPERS